MLTYGLIAAIVSGAPDNAAVQLLGSPCRAHNVLGGRAVLDPLTGRQVLVVTDMNEVTGAELILIDPDADTGTAYRAPAGSSAGSWCVLEVPGERLVVATYYRGAFLVFDLREREFVKVALFPGESYIWNLALGSDGRVFGGTYPGGKLGALDLETYEVEDCGAPAPPNMYLRSASSLPDGRILCSFGMDEPKTLVYDPASKAFSAPPPGLEGVSAGVTWNGLFIAGSRVLEDDTLQPVDPPFPVPPADGGGWAVSTDLSTATDLYLLQGAALFRCRAGDSELTRVGSYDLRGGRYLASFADGTVLGIGGQDYFAIRPGDVDVLLRPIPVEPGPRPTHFLELDPEGKLWGGPPFGQTLFSLDTRTGAIVNTRTICDAGGEVYDATFLDGVVYAAAYAGGDIVRYDPAAPWNQWEHENPVTIASVGPKGYIRPTGGIVVGPDRRLYSGWMAKYGTYGGCVAVTDPDTGATDLIENPLGEQAVEGVAVDGHAIYVGTSLGANGLRNKAGESARFGMIDRATHEVLFQHEFEGASSVRQVKLDAAAGRVLLVVDGSLRAFDPGARELLSGYAEGAPGVGSSVAAPGTGVAYYGSGSRLIAVDVAKGTHRVVAELPAGISCVAAGRDGVFVSCGTDVYGVTEGARD